LLLANFKETDMRTTRALVLLTIAGLGLSAQADPDIHIRTIAATCANCHGPDGESLGPVPSLVGQDKAYLLKAMKEAKTGETETTVMRKYLFGYTEDELDKLAEYFATPQPQSQSRRKAK
jgi:cytochrome c553